MGSSKVNSDIYTNTVELGLKRLGRMESEDNYYSQFHLQLPWRYLGALGSSCGTTGRKDTKLHSLSSSKKKKYQKRLEGMYKKALGQLEVTH